MKEIMFNSRLRQASNKCRATVSNDISRHSNNQSTKKKAIVLIKAYLISYSPFPILFPPVVSPFMSRHLHFFPDFILNKWKITD